MEYEMDRAEMLEDMIYRDQVFLFDDNSGDIHYAVNCNDLWSWGSADLEEIPYNEIENCYRLGPITWACVRRNMKPFPQCEEQMKVNNTWDVRLNSLPLEGEADVSSED